MQLKTIRKQHKWLGIVAGIALLMFCVSGLLLNHRAAIKDCNVSRSLLPSRYEYSKWNGGLLRGTITARYGKVMVYGNGGIFLTDSLASSFTPFNDGLPHGADFRQIRGMVQTANGHLFAVSPFALYRYGAHGAWATQLLPLADDDERLTDIAVSGDTLAVLSRDHIYVATPPYRSFRRLQLADSPDADNRPTAFRTVWLLHSGELFGKAGQLAVDAIAIILAAISVTGLGFWLMKGRKRLSPKLTRRTLAWHNRLGKRTIVLTLIICATGWCLRPPLMVPLALLHIPPVPGPTLSNPNPWHDSLRMIRHDDSSHDWIISTSTGFYSLGEKLCDGISPRKLSGTPPVSVMGLNVWQRDGNGQWICGSFSGLYLWDRQHNRATDYFTHKPVSSATAGPPFGKFAAAGFSSHFSREPVIAEYYKGTDAIAQPEQLRRLPMSLWNVALEMHSGRLFMGSAATYVFVFVMGIAALWCLWTGYRIRIRKRSKRE